MNDAARAPRTMPRGRYRPRHRVEPPPSAGSGAGARALTAGSVALTLPAVVVGLTPSGAHAATTPTPRTTPTTTPTTGPTTGPTRTPVTLYPAPKPAKALSRIVDIASAYQAQDSCDPVAKPGVTAFMNLMLTTFKTGVSAGIVRECYAAGTSEHKEGRAWDWHIPATTKDRATAQHVLTWLVANHGEIARRFGIEYIIWDKHIWGVYRMQDGWRAYSGVSDHTDHIHFSFSWDGAMKRTSWWTGTPVTIADQGPCQPYAGQPAPVYTARRTARCVTPPAAPKSAYSLVWPGQSTSSVKVAQKALKVKVDGTFGASTRTALLAWQRTQRLPITGVLDKATWAKLVPAPVVPPAPPTPKPPPTSPPSKGGSTSASGLPSLDQLAHTTSVSAYLKTVLRNGSRGNAVRALQVALAIKPFDGEFGPITLKAVKAFQASRHLPATGVVDAATWVAVQKVANPLLPYRTVVLKQGSTGPVVKVLQRELGVDADGIFGPKTEAAVKAFQRSAHLASTGVVAVQTWIAIEAKDYPLGRKRW
jgi:peptidoglycan hydrolase-like protein with peptidoglycan-binding domain